MATKERRARARELQNNITQNSRNQVKAIMGLGEALLEIYNDEFWRDLNYRSWVDFCGRGADIAPSTADKYIMVFITFEDMNLADHEYVGITKLTYLCRLAVNKTVARKALKMAKDMDCESFRTWCARESKRLKRKGHTIVEMSERTTQVNLIFEPDEKREFKAALEDIKEELSLNLNGEAAIELVRFWKEARKAQAA